jgi:phospholipid transport system transporter-binding protein
MNAQKISKLAATTPGPARLEALGNGRFKVYGALDADTATDLLKRSDAAFKDAGSLEIDLANVPEGDSAGLALLIEWLRLAKQRRQTIHFKNVPPQIAALARISEVENLLNGNGKH